MSEETQKLLNYIRPRVLDKVDLTPRRTYSRTNLAARKFWRDRKRQAATLEAQS
jgi:hypothetical protein